MRRCRWSRRCSASRCFSSHRMLSFLAAARSLFTPEPLWCCSCSSLCCLGVDRVRAIARDRSHSSDSPAQLSRLRLLGMVIALGAGIRDTGAERRRIAVGPGRTLPSWPTRYSRSTCLRSRQLVAFGYCRCWCRCSVSSAGSDHGSGPIKTTKAKK